MNAKVLGRLKFRAERVRGYLLWAQGFMVLDLWLDKIGVSWLLAAPVGLVLFFVIFLVDRKWLYPGEAEVAWRDNPEWQKLMNKQ